VKRHRHCVYSNSISTKNKQENTRKIISLEIARWGS
jgi:hypothetical protein